MTSRFISDESLWPIAVQVATGPQDLVLHNRMLAAWDSWFARRERVVVLRIYRDAASLEHMPGVAKATKAWMKEGAAEAIRQWVAAMLIVVPPASHEGMSNLDVTRVFGVPGGIFPDTAAALAWLTAHNHPVPDSATLEDILTSAEA